MSLVTAQIQHYQTQLHQYEQKYAELQVTAIWHFLALFVNLIFCCLMPLLHLGFPYLLLAILGFPETNLWKFLQQEYAFVFLM